jgi:6-phosphogluconolactonase
LRDLSAAPARMKREVLRSRNFTRDAAEFILQQARIALAERDQFRMALSGGNTPRPVYTELARIGRDLPWDRVFFTFGDERCVPPEDEQSNFRMARESLFIPGAIPEQSIARMRGEIDPQIAAQEYQDGLDLLAAQRGEMIYRHDLILLGMGDDGHTASLFPGTAALGEKSRKVMANFVPKFESWRITFTFPLIDQARHVCFLVNANKNVELLEKVLAGDREFPAAQVAPANGALTWILGEA